MPFVTGSFFVSNSDGLQPKMRQKEYITNEGELSFDDCS